jgi:hypothetical protein
VKRVWALDSIDGWIRLRQAEVCAHSMSANLATE